MVMRMIRIERVETFLVDVPTIRAHVLAMTTIRVQTLCLVRLHCNDGTVGVGEATTIGGLAYGEESPEGIKLVIDTHIAPILAMYDAARPASVMSALSQVIVGNRFAKCAIETALLDAMGKRVGLPISELIGGRARDRVPVVWTLASGDTATDIAEAEEMLERRRHNIFKLKIGKRTIAEDVAHVAAVKEALGERASVRVDINMAWDLANAKRGIAMLADTGCDLIEQPIASSNLAGMARLTSQARVPVMADEALHGPEDAYNCAVRAAADVFAVKIEQSGGLFAAKRIEAIADAAGIALYGGTMLEAGIGTAASAHVFATFGSLAFGTELFGPLLLTEEILEEALVYEEFSLVVPKGAGLGVKLDDDRISFLCRDAKRPAFGKPARIRTQ
jgi:muconate cycloisomerase